MSGPILFQHLIDQADAWQTETAFRGGSCKAVNLGLLRCAKVVQARLVVEPL